MKATDDTSIDVIEAIKQRKSIRAFKPDSVPKEKLRSSWRLHSAHLVALILNLGTFICAPAK